MGRKAKVPLPPTIRLSKNKIKGTNKEKRLKLS